MTHPFKYINFVYRESYTPLIIAALFTIENECKKFLYPQTDA